MSATFATLPVWKKGASAAEWLEELAALAREHPEQWSRIVVVLEERNDKGQPSKTRQYSRGYENNTDIVGSLEVAKLELWEYMKDRGP